MAAPALAFYIEMQLSHILAILIYYFYNYIAPSSIELSCCQLVFHAGLFWAVATLSMLPSLVLCANLVLILFFKIYIYNIYII